MIYYGQITHAEEFEGTKECVAAASPHVHHVIIVDDGSLSDSQRQVLTSFKNVSVIVKDWEDNFPLFRNHYLDEARRLAEINKDAVPWMLVSDSDECFNQRFCEDVREIAGILEGDYNMAGVNCREAFEPIEWLDDLDRMKESPGGYRESKFWKNLLFRLYPDVSYTGVGETKSVHETLLGGPGWRTTLLSESLYWYTHRKSPLKIWLRAAQNFFIGGGGDNVGSMNPHWVPFRELCSRHNIDTWGQLRDGLRLGLPEEIEERLTDFLWTTPTNYGTEMREMAKYYYILHASKRTAKIEERLRVPPPMPVIDQVKQMVMSAYFECLGRHPDEPGLENYTTMIMTGRINRENLYQILRDSVEAKEKFAK